MNLTIFLHVKNITVTAQSSIARPLVAGEHDEAAVIVEFPRELVQMFPEGDRDLKVVTLVTADIEKRLVAGKCEEVPCRVGADGFLGLPVEITPVVRQGRLRNDTQRVRTCQ